MKTKRKENEIKRKKNRHHKQGQYMQREGKITFQHRIMMSTLNIV